MTSASSKTAAQRVHAPRKQGRPPRGNGRGGREQIIEATKELLKVRSPGSLTRDEIARAAGVTPALIRYYFGNKNNLYAEVILDITGQFTSTLERLAAEKGPVAERLRTYVRAFLQILADNPNYHQLMMEGVIFGETRRARAARRETTLRMVDDLTRMVDEGRANGQLAATDPRFLHVLIIGACEFFVVGAIPILGEVFGPAELKSPAFLDRYAEFLASTLLQGLSARQEPTAKSRRRGCGPIAGGD